MMYELYKGEYEDREDDMEFETEQEAIDYAMQELTSTDSLLFVCDAKLVIFTAIVYANQVWRPDGD